MHAKPTVSIALATYNGARFLQAQLDSLAAQSLTPIELVVGDDGSSDATVEIIEAFARVAPFPVRLYRNETRLDYGDNFMRAAMRCTGEYVAFCDQDDVWLPEKLEVCAQAMAAEGAALCAHGALLVDADLKPGGRFTAGLAPGAYAPLTLDPAGVLLGFTLMFRRDLLELASPDERPDDLFRPGKKLAHDRWAYFLGSTFGSVLYLKTPLAFYRQHGQNTFGADRAMSWKVLQERVQLAAAEQAWQETISSQKAAILKAVAQRSGGETATRALAGAVYWTRLADVYRRRGKVATSASLFGRLKALGGLLAAGGYRPFPKGGLTMRALVKDICVALAPRKAWIATPPPKARAGA